MLTRAVRGSAGVPQIRQIPRDTSPARGQPVALAASTMTFVTVLAREIMDRCPALTSVMWASARWAMKVSSAGGMTWSAVPTTAQDGVVLQAGGPDGSVAAMAAAWLAGTPVAKHPGTWSWLM